MKTPDHHVVIVGGGFGGLYAARALRRAPVRVTLIDRENFHLFQPLLYQVATGSLSPANIAAPIRHILRRQKNATVLLGEVVGVDPQQQTVQLRNGSIHYHSLIVATGATNFYFNNESFARQAPGLKTISEATKIRAKILTAFEAAERAVSQDKVNEELTFVVVGAGPTGLELAGAIADIARRTLRHEYHHIDTTATKVLLVEGQDQVLPSYPSDLAANAARQAERLGVTVRVDTRVTRITPDSVELQNGDDIEVVPTCNVFWAAGVQASGLGAVVAEATGARTDRGGRLHVDGTCALDGFPNLFVIGDLAHFDDGRETPLPGTAAVATQQGKYVASVIKARLRGKSTKAFRFLDLGNMATIGKAAAVCDLGRVHLTGFVAWIVWLFLHLMLLVGFQNRVLVLIQWAYAYFTSSRSARLITQKVPPFLETEEASHDG